MIEVVPAAGWRADRGLVSRRKEGRKASWGRWPPAAEQGPGGWLRALGGNGPGTPQSPVEAGEG